MLSQQGWGYLDARLKQLFNNKETVFGGFNIMFVGDFAQLPPVCCNIIYIDYLNELEIEKIGKVAFGSINTVFLL